MITDSQQHALMVLSSLGIALVLALVITLLFLRRRNWLNSLVYFFSLLYSIPSFAFFFFFLPLSGLGFITALQEIDPQLIEVATGMGMTRQQVFYKVQLPLALPAIFSGLQVALASTMAMATIAATINAGGLGQLLFEGLQGQQLAPILWGTFLTMALTLICAGFLRLLEWGLTHKWRAALAK